MQKYMLTKFDVEMAVWKFRKMTWCGRGFLPKCSLLRTPCIATLTIRTITGLAQATGIELHIFNRTAKHNLLAWLLAHCHWRRQCLFIHPKYDFQL